MQSLLSIRNKLFFAILLFLLVSYSALIYSTGKTFHSSLKNEVRKNLEINLKYARSQYIGRSERIINSLMQPLSTPNLLNKVERHDRAWLSAEVKRWRKVIPFAELLTVVDAHKKVLARVNGEGKNELFGMPGLLDDAFKSKKIIVSTELAPPSFLCSEGESEYCLPRTVNREALVVMVLIPILSQDGRLIGGVIAGDIINKDPNLPFQVKELFGTDQDITVTQRGLRIASTLPDNLPLAFLSPQIMADLEKGLVYRGEMLIGKKVHETVIEPINNSRGEFVGSLSVSLSNERFNTLHRENLANIIASSVLGVICSFGIAYLSARKLTAPLRALAQGVRMIEAGDLDQHVVVASGDEIGVLADSFNRMARALAERGRIINKKNMDLQDLNEQLERKVMERTAELSTEMGRLEVVLTSMAEGVVVTNKDNRVVLFNPAAQQIFDMVPFRVVGQPIEHICEIGEFCFIVDRIKEIAAAGETAVGYQEEMQVKGKNLKINLVAMTDDAGGFAGVLMSIRDVTVEEQVDRMKTEFISTVSHELKTPLTSIKGSLQLLLNKGKWLTETERQLLSVCFRNTQRLIRLIGEILDISKIESGGVTFNFKPYSMGELVVYANEEIKSLAMSRNITIVNSVGDYLPHVYVDHDRIIQVLTNLLSNAVKFSPEGKVVMVSAERDGNYLMVSVSDRGKAIEWADREKLFKKFQQIDRADGNKLGGTGLGLAICKEIIERHHGKIFYSGGTEHVNMFTFSVPIIEEAHEKR